MACVIALHIPIRYLLLRRFIVLCAILEWLKRQRVDYDDGSYTSMTYDAVGRLTYVYDSERGQIGYVYSGNGCVSGCGGTVDKVVKETTPLGVISYAYDAVGLRTSMTVAGQETVYYTYDANSRLIKITQGTRGFVIDYDALGRRTFLTMPNGVTTTYTYDVASNLLNMEHLSPLNEILEKISYVYDVNSNRISMDRFSSFSGLTGESIVKLPEPASNISYNSANRMMTFNDENLIYDENGNLIQKGDAVYEWNARNQLVSITSPAFNASFKYDALGRRIEKTVNGKTTQYLYDGLDIIQEIEAGIVSANYIRTLNIDEPLARIEANGKVRYYQQDALGSVIALTDEKGIVKTQYIYDPYGNTTLIGEQSDNPFQYTGRENDETGLYYYRFRYYSPELQRFISEDPIGLLSGDTNFYIYVDSVGKPHLETNLYTYAFNNPVRYTDPLGLFGVDTIIKFFTKLLAKWGLKDPMDKVVPPMNPSIPEEGDDDHDGIPNFQDPDSPWCTTCKKCH